MDEQNRIEACISLKKNLETVFNSIYDGIISLDGEFSVVNLNDAAAGFFGVRKEDVIGKTCFCDEMLVDVKDVLFKAAAKGEAIRNFSIRLVDFAGDERAVTLSTSILRDEDESQSGVVIILHDISDQLKLQRMLHEGPAYHKLVGKNRKMLELYTLIGKVARSDAPVLLEGESGVGKGLVAEAIHDKSKRAGGPLVKVNCAALSENLLESELFGHVKGAFTGATRDRTGRFELAGGGTIFLDEIGEITPATQVKLLNVLQDRVIEAVGDHRPRKVDIRIIAATNQRLKQLVAEGRFREDLYYRLKVVRIEIPPLRDRPEDIPALVNHFVERQRAETGKHIRGVSAGAMKMFVKYRWPGNVRELENAVAQAFVLCEEGYIGPDSLPEEMTQGLPAVQAAGDGAAQTDNERSRILAALEKTAGQKGKAARLLGIDRTTLWRKMREYRI